MNDLVFLATVGPKCTPIEMYKRAKERLFGALYGKDSETFHEAIKILHRLRKKAFGIFSPFQMEDFLPYPVIHEQKAQEPEKANAYFEEIFAKYRRFTAFEDKITATAGSGTTVQAFGRSIRDSKRNFPVQGTGMF